MNVIWQPIATAPKDGRRIIVYGDDALMATGEPDIWVAAFWDGPMGGWIEPGDGCEITATHWMPLPDPPVE